MPSHAKRLFLKKIKKNKNKNGLIVKVKQWLVRCLTFVGGLFALKGHDGSLDDLYAFMQLLFVDGEGRGQADDVTVGGLGQQPIVTKAQAHLPSITV